MVVGFDLFESQLVQYLLASRLESQGKPLELPAEETHKKYALNAKELHNLKTYQFTNLPT